MPQITGRYDRIDGNQTPCFTRLCLSDMFPIMAMVKSQGMAKQRCEIKVHCPCIWI